MASFAEAACPREVETVEGGRGKDRLALLPTLAPEVGRVKEEEPSGKLSGVPDALPGVVGTGVAVALGPAEAWPERIAWALALLTPAFSSRACRFGISGCGDWLIGPRSKAERSDEDSDLTGL